MIYFSKGVRKNVLPATRMQTWQFRVGSQSAGKPARKGARSQKRAPGFSPPHTRPRQRKDLAILFLLFSAEFSAEISYRVTLYSSYTVTDGYEVRTETTLRPEYGFDRTFQGFSEDKKSTVTEKTRRKNVSSSDTIKRNVSRKTSSSSRVSSHCGSLRLKGFLFWLAVLVSLALAVFRLILFFRLLTAIL